MHTDHVLRSVFFPQSHRLVPPTQQRAKKRSNQSEWATSKFIFDSDDGQSDIQRQHDNISRVYSIHNDEVMTSNKLVMALLCEILRVT